MVTTTMECFNNCVGKCLQRLSEAQNYTCKYIFVYFYLKKNHLRVLF